MYLSPIQLPYFFHAILEVFMISIHDSGPLTSFKILSSYFEEGEYGEDMHVINFLIQFSAFEFSGMKSYCM